MKKKRVIIAVAVFAVILITFWGIVFRNRIVHHTEFSRCSEIVDILEDTQDDYITVIDIIESDNNLTITCKYRSMLSRQQVITTIGKIRSSINKYLQNSEDFYYADYQMKVYFTTEYGSDDATQYEYSLYNFNIDQDIKSNTLDCYKVAGSCTASDISDYYEIKSIESCVGAVSVDDFTFFENNPQLEYARVYLKDKSELDKLKTLCPDCEFDVIYVQ